MAYLPSTYSQQRGLVTSANLQIQVNNSIQHDVSTLKKKFEQNAQKYAEGDQKSGSEKPTVRRKSPIYVHEVRHIPTRIPSSSSDRFNKKKSVNLVHQNVYHECGNHNHMCMKQNPLLTEVDSICAAKSECYRKGQKITKLPVKMNSKVLTGDIAQLEETYWANWRPNKNRELAIPKHVFRITPHLSAKESEPTLVQKEAMKETNDGNEGPPHKTANNKIFLKAATNINNVQIISDPPKDNPQNKELRKVATEHSVKTNLSYYSQEYETNRIDYDESLLSDKQKEPCNEISAKSKPSSSLMKNNLVDVNLSDQESDSDMEEVTSLKHTDSFILTAKKQSQEKPNVQQPLAIRLFRHPGYSASAKISKGRSFPLKPILKKEISAKKPSPIRLGKPGSPIIVSTKSNRRK